MDFGLGGGGGGGGGGGTDFCTAKMLELCSGGKEKV